MNTELFGIIITFFATLLLAYPLGIYIARVYAGERTLLDGLMGPVERGLFSLSLINSKSEMTWQEHLSALLTINFIWFFFAMFILMNQAWLPLNPDGNPSMPPDLAFNTAISFLVNCNLQHYSGEIALSYFSQIVCIMFLQFVTAGTGMAAAAIVFNAMKGRSADRLGNFYVYFVKSCTRILLPISFVSALVLMYNGIPMTFEGKTTIVNLEGDTVQVSTGPAAGMIAIKQAGTNGGGFFGVNSAHPLENPNYLSNMLEAILILLIPIAMVFAVGHFLKNKRLSRMIFGVMTLGFLLLLFTSVYYETKGNPAIANLGISQELGSMEGKEIRLGAAASAYWGIVTTVTSNGSVNSMHDSHTPMSGAMQMLGMMINSLYGGVGVGFLNFYIFIILSVFIGGLMVGRTPELLGKKIEGREMKIAMIVALLHPFLILLGAGLSTYKIAVDPGLGWLNNPDYHGLSEILYEYTSSAANNGSGFEGLGDNTLWWNISCGIVLILSRYIPIIGPIAIAGILAQKKYIPESSGSLRVNTLSFGLLVFAIILIIAALAFFPALTLGPIAEHFTLH